MNIVSRMLYVNKIELKRMLYVNKIELKNVTRVHGHFIKSVNNNSIQFKVYWQTIGNHLPLAIHIYTCTYEIKLFFFAN